MVSRAFWADDGGCLGSRAKTLVLIRLFKDSGRYLIVLIPYWFLD